MTEKIFPNKRDDEVTSMMAHVWFLRFLEKFREGREPYEQIAMRLMTSRKLDPEQSKKLKQEMANYEKFM
ncbi:unnamed protein product [marine sediment metagenome]|uniref:Uncharacterized protein n=1 Tax=marine sediment metagenome TaxID=412755 RepID=X1AVQ9_9ZZZZ